MDGEVERDDSADQEEVRGGVNKKKKKRGEEGASRRAIARIPSLSSLYHGPRSWRMNSDPSQPSAEAR